MDRRGGLTLRVLYASASHGVHDRRFLQYLRDAADIDGGYVLIARSPTHAEARLAVADLVDAVWTVDSEQPVGAIAAAMSGIFGEFGPHVVHAGPVPTVTYVSALANAPGLTGMSWGFDLLLDVVESADAGRRAREALSRCRAFIADCEAVRRAAIELGMEATRTVVLPWGVDVDQFSPQPIDRSVRRRHGIPDDAFVFFTNRAWEELYRVDLVIQSFDQIARSLPNAWLVVAGDGSLATGIRSSMARSPARVRIVEAGRLSGDSMVAHYKSSDVYVSASRIDGSSVSLLEAMACGVPAIVVDHAANREWVTEGETGWLFERDDVADLTRCMRASVRRRGDWGRMGALARRTIERRADWSQRRSRVRDAYGIAIR